MGAPNITFHICIINGHTKWLHKLTYSTSYICSLNKLICSSYFCGHPAALKAACSRWTRFCGHPAPLKTACSRCRPTCYSCLQLVDTNMILVMQLVDI